MGKAIVMQVFLKYFLPENVPSSSWRRDKPCFSLFWVTPHHVTKRSIMRNLLKSIQTFYLVYRLYERRQAAMYGKYVTIGNRTYRKEVKQIGVHFPNCSASKLILTFHVEAIILSDCPQLVISSYQQYLTRVFQLEQTKEGNSLDAMCSSIDVVTKEKIAGVWQLASNFEYFKDVEELSMNVANYCDGQRDSLHVFLLNEDVLELKAQDLNSLLVQYLAFESFLKEPVNVEPHLTFQINKLSQTLRQQQKGRWYIDQFLVIQ